MYGRHLLMRTRDKRVAESCLRGTCCGIRGVANFHQLSSVYDNYARRVPYVVQQFAKRRDIYAFVNASTWRE